MAVLKSFIFAILLNNALSTIALAQDCVVIDNGDGTGSSDCSSQGIKRAGGKNADPRLYECSTRQGNCKIRFNGFAQMGQPCNCEGNYGPIPGRISGSIPYVR